LKYLVIPFFNESKRFDPQYFQALFKMDDSYWVLVDDGSEDDTYLKLKEFSSIPNVIILKNQMNLGKAESVRIGMQHIMNNSEVNVKDENLLGFLDADGAFNLAAVETFLRNASELLVSRPEYFAVWSSRVKLSGRNIQRNPKRHYLGRIINTIMGTFIPYIPYDSQSGLKVFRHDDILSAIINKSFLTKWLFDIELLIRMHKKNLAVYEQPVDFWRDVRGGTLGTKQAVQIISEIIKIKRLQKRELRD
jgi:glycosyltransferase involved in cell wall biosynthesis